MNTSTRRSLAAAGLICLVAVLVASPARAAIWSVEEIEQTRTFDDFHSRAIALGAGRVHLVYGGKHLYYSSNDGTSWDAPEVVDPSPNVGRYAAVAVDSSGFAHVSYYDAANGDLRYATNSGGAWSTHAVDRSGDVGRYCSIAVDSSDAVHISYHDAGRGKLRYASNASGVWETATADEIGGRGSHTSIAIDEDDRLFIAYYDRTDADLRIAVRLSGTWTDEIVDATNDAGRYAAIAVDSGGVVHISYNVQVDGVDGTEYFLKHAQGTPGAWSTEVVDSSGSAGTYTSIAVDGAGELHVSYHAWFLDISDPAKPDYTSYLRYATGSFGSWSRDNIESSDDPDLGKHTSIVTADAAMLLQVHISYLGANGDLRVADYGIHPPQKLPDWQREAVDESRVVGTCTSIALDTDDRAHVSYVDNTGQKVKYATNASGSWATTQVIATSGTPIHSDSGALIRTTSIAIDAAGTANIAYYGADENLLLAVDTPLGWSIEPVDNGAAVGRYAAMVLDGDGRAHVAYWNGAENALWYATGEPGSWHREEVDSYAGKYPAIALDIAGNVHISYHYEHFSIVSDKQLLYATNSTGSWVTETVDDRAYVGEYSAIAVDSSSTVHITYFDLTNGDLKYSHGTAGGWETEIIDSDGYVGMYTSLGLDSKENLHVSYHGWTTDSRTSLLKYANNTAGTWRFETVSSGGKVGAYSSIAVDSEDKVHVSYFDASNATPVYASATAMNVTVAPGAHDFGEVVQQTTSAPLRVTITNNGASSVQVTDLVLSDTTSFVLDVGEGSNPCDSPTPTVGDSCTVTVSFVPFDASAYQGALTVKFADPLLPNAAVLLSGTGTVGPNPDIAVSPDAHDFGDIGVGKRSPVLDVSIHNNGGGDLDVSAIELSDVESFAADIHGGPSPCGEDAPVVPAGGACTVAVRYAPASRGVHAATLTISSDDPDSERVAVSLNGSGTPGGNEGCMCSSGDGHGYACVILGLACWLWRRRRAQLCEMAPGGRS